MFNKLKEIKDLRDQAKQLQNQLAQETISASAEGGKINIVMDGNQQVVGLDINPELLSVEKKTALENGIREAHNDAVKQVQRIMAQKLQGGNFKLPNIG